MSRKIIEKPDIELNADLIAKLESLPDKLKRGWTEEQDKILLEYFGKKCPEDVAKIIGYSVEACRKRYLRLTNG